MVAYEQDLVWMYEMLQDLWNRTGSVDDAYEEISGYIVGMNSAQSRPVPGSYACLPERLSRDQAQPLCVLEGSCKRSGQCYGDCDCNPDAQAAWAELRTRLLASTASKKSATCANPTTQDPPWTTTTTSTS